MRRPPDAVLAALSLALVLPPFGRLAGLPGVGSYSMFSNLGEYRLSVEMETASAPRRLDLRELGPHLGNDARRVLLPGSRWRSGETSVELLAGALQPIGDLVCRLHREAEVAEVVLETRRPGEREAARRRSVRCAR